jgi:hypothetical protein
VRRLLRKTARHRRERAPGTGPMLSLHCSGIKPVLYRSQESISVSLIFCRVPCVTNRSRIELIEPYCFRVPIELHDRNGKRERP